MTATLSGMKTPTPRAAIAAMIIAIVATAAMAAAPDDFTLEPVAPPFRLSQAKGKFVALHFLLKTECPYCLKHVHDYATRAGELDDVIQLFIKPDSAAEIRAWQTKLVAK